MTDIPFSGLLIAAIKLPGFPAVVAVGQSKRITEIPGKSWSILYSPDNRAAGALTSSPKPVSYRYIYEIHEELLKKK